MSGALLNAGAVLLVLSAMICTSNDSGTAKAFSFLVALSLATSVFMGTWRP